MKRVATDMSKWTKKQLIERIRMLENRSSGLVLPSTEGSSSRDRERGNASEKDGAKIHQGGGDCAKRKISVNNQIEEDTLLTRGVSSTSTKKKKMKRNGNRRGTFDMSRFRQRHIALMVAYDGEGYSGFAHQKYCDKTTEEEIFRALKKTCLIESKDTCRYSRCGRTDKDVNGMGQVVALNVRSKLRSGIVFAPRPALVDAKATVCEIGDDNTFEVVVKSTFQGEDLVAKVRLPAHATIAELSSASDSALGIASEDIEAFVAAGGKRLNEGSLLAEQLGGWTKLTCATTTTAVDENDRSAEEATKVKTIPDDDQDANVDSLYSPSIDRKEIASAAPTITLIPKSISPGTALDGDSSGESDYVMILNRVLPDNIRILGWSPAKRDFDARFSCKSRTYRYFFPRRNLDVDLMQDAAKRLVGKHDFRNFCKMDAVNVSNFVREILSCRILEVVPDDGAASATSAAATVDRSVLAFEVRGRGFLYHQVRCLIAILFLVGQGNEKPGVVDWLLKTSEVSSKPLYQYAPGFPLLFYQCEFADLRFRRTDRATAHLRKCFEARWCKHAVQMATTRTLLDSLDAPARADGKIYDRHDFSEARNAKREYVPLNRRSREKTYEERVGCFKSGRKARFDRNKALRDGRDTTEA
eukprot:g3750.t1